MKNTRAITAYNVVQWFRWADAADSSIVKEVRAERVRTFLFPDDLPDEESAVRERLCERARRLAGDGDKLDGWPEPYAPPGEDEIEIPALGVQHPEEPLPEWGSLVPRHSKAYRRASMRDGTQAGTDEMRIRSQGSPFDIEPPPAENKRSSQQEETLAKRNRELARRIMNRR